MTRRSALLAASPAKVLLNQGNVPFRPHCGVGRRLFGSAKRRSFLLALRAERHVRKPVISVNRPSVAASPSGRAVATTPGADNTKALILGGFCFWEKAQDPGRIAEILTAAFPKENMKKITGFICACTAALAVATTSASALTSDAPAVTPASASQAGETRTPTPMEQAIRDQRLRKLGIDPDSTKARILNTWVDRIRTDPAIITAVPGGVDGISQMPLDPTAGTALVGNGLARLPEAERLEFFSMLTTIYDQVVPQDCYGLTDQKEVMRRAISFTTMSDAQIDTYFRLIYRMVHQWAVNAPVDAPTPAQHQAALIKLGTSMEAQLHGNKADIERLAAIVVDQPHASPIDRCWMMHLSLHAIAALPEADRDVVLRQLYAVDMKKVAAAAAAPAAPAAPAASAAPAPFTLQSAG